MSDLLARLLDEAAGAQELWEVAAIFDAVPGWHAVVIERGLTEASHPNAKYGVEYVRVVSIPIILWGVRCPSRLLKRPMSAKKQPKLEPRGRLRTVLDDVFSGAVAEVSQQVQPLDSRVEAPAFFRRDQLVGVYPPSEGSADDVLERCKKELAEHTEREIALAKKREAPSQ